MNRKPYILILIIAGFFFSACQKNTDIFVPDPVAGNGLDTAWYSSITATMPVSALKGSLLTDNTYHDSILVNNSATYITSPSGLQCIFPPNACVGNAGQVITGNVNVDLALVKSKGDMIRLGKPTTSNGRLLVSGGEIFIKLKKDGNPVQLAPNVRIQLRYPDAPIDPLMKIFYGDDTNPLLYNWLPVTDTNSRVTAGTQVYEILTDRLGWINCDRFYDTTTAPRVIVTANLASNFTNANTVAYTVFKDMRAVVGMNGDVGTKKFSTGKIPGGKAITVVVISKQGNDYFLGFENVVTITSTSANAVQTVSVTPVKRSLSDINYFLNTL